MLKPAIERTRAASGGATHSMLPLPYVWRPSMCGGQLRAGGSASSQTPAAIWSAGVAADLAGRHLLTFLVFGSYNLVTKLAVCSGRPGAGSTGSTCSWCWPKRQDAQ